MLEDKPLEPEDGTIIKIVGVGGAGANALENMLRQGLSGVEYIVANTDADALARSAVSHKLQLGKTGLGAGAKPRFGFEAAKAARYQIRNSLEGTHLLFIVAGMGGGTGTGAVPVIASIAREMGILTIGMVTSPFNFEGVKRMQVAKSGIAKLVRQMDSLIVIHNEKIMPIMGEDAEVDTCFQAIDDLFLHLVGGLCGILLRQDLVACDFEDIRTVMGDMGLSSMGTGSAIGDKRALIAAENAIASPYFGKNDLAVAGGVAVIISGTRQTIRMAEVNEVMNKVKEIAAENAHIIFGVAYDPSLGETLRVVIVACGIDRTRPPKPNPTDPMPPGGVGRRLPTLDDLRKSGTDIYDIPAFLRKSSQ